MYKVRPASDKRLQKKNNAGNSNSATETYMVTRPLMALLSLSLARQSPARIFAGGGGSSHNNNSSTAYLLAIVRAEI